MPSPKEIIKLGQLEIRFLLDSHDTGGVNSVFEFVVPAGAKVPAPHHHLAFDELVYGLEGSLTFVVDGKATLLQPGDQCFVPRGSVHHFVNEGTTTTRALSVITPALLGPAYFRDLAALLGSGPPNPVKVAEVMMNHGLVAVPN